MYYPYLKKAKLLSHKELEFYNKLRIIVEPKGLVIFASVRLADVVYVPKTYRYFNLFFSRIKAKQIDFVVCDRATSEIRCLIELDDKTHSEPQRQSRDKFVNKVISKAKIAFIRCSSPDHVCQII